ncbi:MAG: hypothetical protein ACXVA1_17940 [Mucilaginibacter sp.]
MANFSCHSKESKVDNAERVSSHVALKGVEDTICSFHKISKASGLNLSEEFTDVNYTFLFQNTLYLLGSGTKNVLMMNIGTGVIKKSEKLNKVIETASKTLGFPGTLFITKGRIYIGFDQGVICIDDDYKLLYQIQGFYNNYFVNQIKQVILIGDFNWTIYSDSGQLIKKVDKDMELLHFYKSNDNEVYCDDQFILKKVSIDADSLKKEVVAKPEKFNDFEPMDHDYPGIITKDYIFWFNFSKRDKLIITDKSIKKIVKTIPFKGVNWAMTREEQNDAAGNPTFFVDVDGDNFYVSVYKGDTLLVYKGCLGLKNIN